MKRILLINPPSPLNRKIIRNIDCSFESKGNYLYQPMDLMQLSGVFNTGEWAVNVIDAVASKLSSESVIELSKAFDPDIVVLAMGDINWQPDLLFLKHLSKIFKHKYILGFGDSFADDDPLSVVADYLNGIIVSPWDIDPTLFERTPSIEWKDLDTLSGIIFPKNPQRPQIKKSPSCRSIPHPKHELFLHKRYRWPFARHFRYATVFTAWGCPNKCDYCLLSKSPLLYRNSEAIIDELKNISSLGVKEVYFADRSFGAPIENIKLILHQIVKKKFELSWSAYFHPNMYSFELLNLMKKSGCHTIIIGVESHDLKILEQYSRSIDESKLSSLIEHAKKIGVGICADFLLGLEGQTEDDVLKTIEYAIKHNFDYASFNILAPLPGTRIRSEAIKSGKINSDTRHFDSLGKNAVLSSDCLSASDLIRLRNLAVRKFYLRASYFFQRLYRTTSLTHLIIQLLEMKSIFGKSKN